MTALLKNLHPVVQALVATCFTWAMTALGAAAVFTAREIKQKTLDIMLGFAGGVMVAASYWSLLAPAIELSAGKDIPAWVPAVVGFLVGGLFLQGIDRLLPHLHLGLPTSEAEGVKTSWRRSTLLVLAITLHNIPEGLAVGVAFRALASGTGNCQGWLSRWPVLSAPRRLSSPSRYFPTLWPLPPGP
jgi:ZIP family zinc transporter